MSSLTEEQKKKLDAIQAGIRKNTPAAKKTDEEIIAEGKRVAAKAKIELDRMKPKAPAKKEGNWVTRLTGKVKGVFASEKKEAAKETARAKNVSSSLKQAGLTDDEINRLKGKKK